MDLYKLLYIIFFLLWVCGLVFFLKRFYFVLTIKNFPLAIWLTTPKGKVLFSSSMAKALLKDITPESLPKWVEEEDASLAKYLRQLPIKGVSRQITLKFKGRGEINISQSFYKKNYILWLFQKQSTLKNVHSFDSRKFLNKNPEYIIEKAPQGIILIDDRGSILDNNFIFRSWFNKEKGAQDSFSKNNPEDLKTYFKETHIEILDNFLSDLFLNRLSTLSAKRYIATLKNEESTPVVLWGAKLPVVGKQELYVVYFQDVSWEKNIEKQFTQAQRMQALGQLSGSIAHDFNNILTGIVGFSDILLSKYTPGQKAFSEIMQIKQNAYRGANLVKQLMSFSRHQAKEIIQINITNLIIELEPIFKRLLGNNIELKLNLARKLDLINIDPSQFEQILMNFVVNARDAIGDKGSVVIMTENLEASTPFWHKNERIEPGDYVKLEVQDTGCGIPEEQLSKVFDPFYTSKEEGLTVGSGAGLGLATVYSIMQQAQGYVFVDSSQGKGTKFTVLFPRSQSIIDNDQSSIQSKEQEIEEENYKNFLLSSFSIEKEQIFLVEDDEVVRNFTEKALQKKGYTVFSFSSADLVLKYLESHPKSTIDLLITDVIMPKMNGTELASKLYKKFPTMQIIFISGYSEVNFDDLSIAKKRMTFLQKPYELRSLIIKVHEKLKDSLKQKKLRAR